jgi:hypothetical protein
LERGRRRKRLCSSGQERRVSCQEDEDEREKQRRMRKGVIFFSPR